MPLQFGAEGGGLGGGGGLGEEAGAEGGGVFLQGFGGAGVLQADEVTIKATLSGLRDLDYAEAISRYHLESSALQAAQTVFTQMQSMNLFNALR